MSSGRARDILYGRRGGGWVDEPRHRPPAAPVPEAHPTTPAPAAVELATLFDPDVDDPAHQKTGPGEPGDGSGPALVDGAITAGPWSRPGALPPRVVLDPEVLFAPETIAAHRAHARQCRGRHDDGEPCPAVVDPEDLAAVRAGRARMARARLAAGVALSAGDRAALAWHDEQQGAGR